jgi:hypothetical protein
MKNTYTNAIEFLNEEMLCSTPIEMTIANQTYNGTVKEMKFKAIELDFENVKADEIVIKSLLYTYTITANGIEKKANF